MYYIISIYVWLYINSSEDESCHFVTPAGFYLIVTWVNTEGADIDKQTDKWSDKYKYDMHS